MRPRLQRVPEAALGVASGTSSQASSSSLAEAEWTVIDQPEHADDDDFEAAVDPPDKHRGRPNESALPLGEQPDALSVPCEGLPARVAAAGSWEIERTLLGILSRLLRELSRGSLRQLGSSLSSLDPISAALLWRQQASARAARKAAAAYCGPPPPSPPLPPMLPLLAAVRHAGAVYGSLAFSFADPSASVTDLLRGSFAATKVRPALARCS